MNCNSRRLTLFRHPQRCPGSCPGLCGCVWVWEYGCFKVGDNRLRHNKTTGPADAVLGNFLHGKLESKQSLLFWLNFSHSTRLCVAVNDDKAAFWGLWIRFKVNICVVLPWRTLLFLNFCAVSASKQVFYGPLHSNIGLSHLKSDSNSSSPQTQLYTPFYKPNKKI